MRFFAKTLAALLVVGTAVSAQSIGSGNTFDPARDQVGIARDSTFEGYSTWTSFVAAVVDEIPYVTGGSYAANTLTFTRVDGSTFTIDVSDLDDSAGVAGNLAALNAHITADGDTTADSVPTSPDGSITFGGSGDAPTGQVNVTNIISGDAGNAATTGGDGGIFVSTPAAPTVVSTDAGNDISAGSDGGAYLALPAVSATVSTDAGNDITAGADGGAFFNHIPSSVTGAPGSQVHNNGAGATTAIAVADVNGQVITDAEGDSVTVPTGSGPVTVSTAAPITGDGSAGNPITLPGGTNGQILTTDAGGNAVWTTPGASGGGGINGLLAAGYATYSRESSGNGTQTQAVPASSVNRILYVTGQYTGSGNNLTLSSSGGSMTGRLNATNGSGGTTTTSFSHNRMDGYVYVPAGVSLTISVNGGNNSENAQMTIRSFPAD